VPALARRTQEVSASATVAMNNLVAAKRRAGSDVVAFNIGEPDFDTPQFVKDAAKKALDAGKTKYTPSAGIMELRDAIARTEKADNKIPCEGKNVVVTPAKMGVFIALQTVGDLGTEILVPDPGWVSYAPMVAWAQAKPIPVGLDEQFRMTPDAVAEAITPKTRCILLNSPSNPTGGINTPADVKGIVELAADHDLWILSDEIYQKLQYSGTHTSPAALPGGWDRTLTINGLSKSFAMTGWRVGWVIAPDAVTKEVDKFQSQSITHITSFTQDAALAAVTGPQDSVTTMKDAFRRRRDLLVAGLRHLPGVTCPEPAGAFYVFPRFDPKHWHGLDDDKLALDLLDKANVATTAGGAFGSKGKNHLRFSYATSEARIQEGLARLAKYQATK
jgi:aspartate aminotransferase